MTSKVMVQMLGTGTIRSEQTMACSSSLIKTQKDTILVDCGPGCLIRLREAGNDVRHINRIFITHFHPDHISDLVSILFAYYHSGETKKIIEINGPAGLNALTNNLRITYGSWMHSELFLFQELQSNEITIPDGKMKWLKVRHNEESIGFRFQLNDKVISFSGDSGDCPELIELSEDANLAIFECAHPNTHPDPFHLNPSALAEIVTASQAKKIVLTHLYPETMRENPLAIIRKRYKGPVSVATDLDKFYV
jgi:ribonuclease BN (tRNA processing enzyme)